MTTAFSYRRFSSKPQERGDSLRRQTKLAEQYAKQHNLSLDSRSYQDLGISAFKGKNQTEGALGAFLSAVDAGLIPSDAFLLVESLDRLSRQEVDEALELFLSITRRGITIVTLTDGMRYSRASIKENWTSLVVALAVMSRANEESATKSRRIKEAWANKRASGQALTRMCPSWLQVLGNSYVPIPEKVKVVQQVFELAAHGYGSPTIADKMNDAHTPCLGKAEYWEPGIVQAILKNRAVIGELVSRKTGEAQTLYPPIIAPEQFYLVQEHIAKRRGTGGRRGNGIANLFSGLTICECGSRLRFVSGAKPHLYLRCVRAYSNVGCDAPTIPYTALEHDLMSQVLVWAKLPLREAPVADPKLLLRAELDDKRRKLANYTKVIEAATDVAAPAVLLRNMASLETEIAELEGRLKAVSASTPLSSAVQGAVLLWSAHERATLEERQDLRLRLQAELKRLFTKIVTPTALIERDGQQYLRTVWYGPIVEASPFETSPFFTDDGGYWNETLLPKWGFGRRRTNRQQT
jgi:DNA invertase Pin-like site-specific DNA recombinase